MFTDIWTTRTMANIAALSTAPSPLSKTKASLLSTKDSMPHSPDLSLGTLHFGSLMSSSRRELLFIMTRSNINTGTRHHFWSAIYQIWNQSSPFSIDSNANIRNLVYIISKSKKVTLRQWTYALWPWINDLISQEILLINM